MSERETYHPALKSMKDAGAQHATESSVEQAEKIREHLKDMLDFVRFTHNQYKQWRDILELTPEDLIDSDDPEEQKKVEQAKDNVMKAFDVMRNFDRDGEQEKLFNYIKEIPKYKKILRHDMPTAANVYALADEMKESYNEGDVTAEDIFGMVKHFVSEWSRFYIGIEHLAIHTLADEEIPEVFKEQVDLRTVLDAIMFWVNNSGVCIRKGRPEGDIREDLTMFKDKITIDPSVFAILDTDDEYEGNTGVFGRGIRSQVHNGVKSKDIEVVWSEEKDSYETVDGGAEMTLYAEVDNETGRLALILADNGDGITQDRLNPDSQDYILREGVSTDGGDGIGMAGLDRDLARFDMHMEIYSKSGMYPNSSRAVTAEVQEKINTELKKYPVGKDKQPASTVVKFFLHKKAA